MGEMADWQIEQMFLEPECEYCGANLILEDHSQDCITKDDDE